jgi:cobalt-zinc-cadmium efflux system protein
MADDHDQSVADVRETQRRALWLALGANALFMVVEVAGGIAFHSLALLADAAHMLSDVAGLSIALVAQTLMTRPATARHSFGLQRAEVLGAQANAFVLLAVAGWIVIEAMRRIGDPVDVAGRGLIVVAVLGLAVNVGSAFVLARARSHGPSLSLKGAFLHMVADAAGSLGAIAAGVAVLAWGAGWVDPVVSIVIAALVLWAAWGLLRDATHVLLEGTPRGTSPDEVERALSADGNVETVHHLHLWTLASDAPALSAHVVLRGEVTLHEAQARGDQLKLMLAERFGITHATLELECHACEPSPDEYGRVHEGVSLLTKTRAPAPPRPPSAGR